MKKLLILSLTILAVVQVNATVKKLGQIKLKETVVTAVQSDNSTITVSNDSNISTDYRGITGTNFVIDVSSSNPWYYITTEYTGTNTLVIIPWSRESATIVCNDYFPLIYISPITNSIAGLKQSFIELIYTNPTNVTYEVIKDPSFSIGYANSLFGKKLTGPSTNLVVISSVTENKSIAESVTVIESK